MAAPQEQIIIQDFAVKNGKITPKSLFYNQHPNKGILSPTLVKHIRFLRVIKEVKSIRFIQLK